MQLLATSKPGSCQKWQIKHLREELALCSRHTWFHVPKHTGFHVIDVRFHEVPSTLSGMALSSSTTATTRGAEGQMDTAREEAASLAP